MEFTAINFLDIYHVYLDRGWSRWQCSFFISDKQQNDLLRTMATDKAFPAWQRKRCENTVIPVPSFRAKARNLFRLRSRRNGRASENGKHGTPYALGSRRFIREGNSERSTKSSLGGVYEERLFVIAMLFCRITIHVLHIENMKSEIPLWYS